MNKTKSFRLLCVFALILTSDLIWGMCGLTEFEVPILIGWIITAVLLFKYEETLNNYLKVSLRVILILNVIVSAIFLFLIITCQGPFQIDFIADIYEHLFGWAVIPPEYKWANDVLVILLLMEAGGQMLFKIMSCIVLYQSGKIMVNGKIAAKFIKTASIAYIPFYILAKTFNFIIFFIRDLIIKNEWSSNLSEWWMYHASDVMIYLWLSATVIFLVIALVRVFYASPKLKA